jgi:hypothetical protein
MYVTSTRIPFFSTLHSHGNFSFQVTQVLSVTECFRFVELLSVFTAPFKIYLKTDSKAMVTRILDTLIENAVNHSKIVATEIIDYILKGAIKSTLSGVNIWNSSHP